MGSEERRNRLLELIRLDGFSTLPNLANLLKVSGSTVRRDLGYLERLGSVRRTHGGVFYTGPSPKLPHFDHRQQQQFGRKQAIARLAAALIEDGDTLLLDGGSTTYELASLLIGRPLQVVTNSLPVATLFTSGDGSDLVLIGGYVHGRTGVSVGPYANLMLAELNVQKAIISVAGITYRGVFNSNLLLVETERAMCKAADSVMVVADSTKFGRSSLALMCELEQLDSIVIDDGIETQWVEKLEAADVQVHIAATDKQTEIANEG